MGYPYQKGIGGGRPVYKAALLFAAALLLCRGSGGQDDFRVLPYLQHPAPGAMTVVWFSEESEPGIFMCRKSGSGGFTTLTPLPEPAESLAFSAWEDSAFFNGEAPHFPYRQRVRVENLEPATLYEYIVIQGSTQFSAEFETAPKGDSPVRFIVYADAETEPESTGEFTEWPDPVTGDLRPYLVDQTTGTRNNLEVISSRAPDLVVIAGDLVESGGEQRDWDEFWRHLAGPDGGPGLAARVPLLAAPGNHEYYNGPQQGGYDQPGSERAISRYLTYFEYPANHSLNERQEGRYYAITYGPAVFIVLDACNNSPNSTGTDTNFLLLGEGDEGGGDAPDFLAGSRQYDWLEEQLAASQQEALFTFVVMHHAPYSSGPHGFPPGTGEHQNDQSGFPVRELTPLLMKYGVDAVFSGHDEMWERSEVRGTEERPGGDLEPHTLHFYDVGIGGDGLRGPEEGTENPFQVFLAHTDAPEVWEDSALVSGGKHYGHLEVDIVPGEEQSWHATLSPVYVLPVKKPGDTACTLYERRLYDDRITLVRTRDTLQTTSGALPPVSGPSAGRVECRSYPNPFRHTTLIGFELSEEAAVTVRITDLRGRELFTTCDSGTGPGFHEIPWDGRDRGGNPVAPGIYCCRIRTGTGRERILKLVRY